jgi:hypothetical protein
LDLEHQRVEVRRDGETTIDVVHDALEPKKEASER